MQCRVDGTRWVRGAIAPSLNENLPPSATEVSSLVETKIILHFNFRTFLMGNLPYHIVAKLDNYINWHLRKTNWDKISSSEPSTSSDLSNLKKAKKTLQIIAFKHGIICFWCQPLIFKLVDIEIKVLNVLLSISPSKFLDLRPLRCRSYLASSRLQPNRPELIG